MNSNGEKDPSRNTANRQRDGKRSKVSPAGVNRNGSAPHCGSDNPVKPVRLTREDAQKNIPPESDPDDPVAP